MRTLLPSHLGEVVERAASGEYTATAPGAVLLFDAEGSTALSARLREHGTLGAESLADLLTAVFGPIVERVIEAGGFVAHFTGDGVVAVFPGPHDRTVPAAIGAGVRIMADLTDLGEVATPAGGVRLAVRAIVGAGTVTSLLWHGVTGTEAHQDSAYLYLGTALDEAQRGEDVVEGGSLGIGPVAASAVQVGGTAPLASGYVRLADAAALPPDAGAEAVGHREDGTTPATSAGWRFLPVGVGDLPVRGEFRQVVCAFVGLRTTPPAGTGEGPMQRVLTLAGRYGGYVANLIRPKPDDDGVTLLVVWGAPASHERDLGRSLRFADRLRAELPAGTLRAGVTFDTVFAGYVGGPAQQSYTVVGAGVNLAARLCAAAAWGEVRVDGSIASRLPAGWDADDLGLVGYKGFAAPVPTGALRGRRPVTPSPAGPIVGRARDVHALEAALEPLDSGMPAGIVAVVGDAGIGKSRLVAEVGSRAAAGTTSRRWIAVDAGDAHVRPFGVITEVVTALLDDGTGRRSADTTGGSVTADRLARFLADLGRADPAAAPELERSHAALGDLLGVPSAVDAASALDPRSRFDNVVHAVQAVIGAVARDRPLVMAIDAEQLDPSTVEVITRLHQAFPDVPVALVVESRRPAVPIPVDQVVALDGLDEESVADLARQVLGDEASPALLTLLVERTGGNPYFVAELAHYLRREGLMSAGELGLETGDVAAVPARLSHALVARLDSLPVEVRRTLQTAAVLGREFDADVLGHVLVATGAGDADLADDLAAAVDSGAVERQSGSRHRFRHALLRDAAYAMQLHSVVRGVHLAAARSLRAVHDDSRPGVVAHHYDRAGAVDDASRWYVLAGERAAARFANTEALDRLGRALELVGAAAESVSRAVRASSEPADDGGPPGADSYEVLRRICEIHARLGHRDEEEAALDRMESLAGDPLRASEVLMLRAELADVRSRFDEAADHVEAALRLLEPLPGDDPAVVCRRADLLLTAASVERERGRADRAEPLARRAESEYGSVGAAVGAARAENLRGSIAWDRGDFDQAAAHHRAAAEAAAGSDDAVGEILYLNGLGTALFGLGDYSAARVIHEQGVARCRRIGFGLAESNHLDNLAGTAWAVGDLDLAVERYTEALAIRRRTGHEQGIAISVGNIGGARRLQGDLVAALACYTEALGIDRRIGRRRGEAFDRHGLGLVHLDRGDPDAATGHLRQAIDIRDELGETHHANESRAALAAALAALGDDDEAVAVVDLALAGEPDLPFVQAIEPVAATLHAIAVLADERPARAERLRVDATAWLRAAAARIGDPAQRRSFLEAVPAHRELIALGDRAASRT